MAARAPHYPTAIPDIVRVVKMNILGITVSDTHFHHHISALVAKSARSFYALKTIRAHGLDGNALWDVTRATLVSQLLYASPAWWVILMEYRFSKVYVVYLAYSVHGKACWWCLWRERETC